MITPEQAWPVVNTLRFGIGLAFLSVFQRPEATLSYRRRFWVAMPALAAIALIGLRPLSVHWAARDWVAYGALFQAIFNFGVISVLLLRYRLYMPHGNVQSEDVAR